MQRRGEVFPREARGGWERRAALLPPMDFADILELAMPTVIFIAFSGKSSTVDVPEGTTLMRAATDNGVPGIDGDCGGNCACATCHVYISPAWRERVGGRNAAEQDMLTCVAELRDNSRLACQITVTEALNGLVVDLPEAQH
jgi:2Fe-2S ferredoxin